MSLPLFERVLPRRACRQPETFRKPGGDCAACCLAGLLGWSVDDVYAAFPGGVSNHIDQAAALVALHHQGRFDRVITELPLWPHEVRPVFAHRGFTASAQAGAWFRYLVMALDAGYYALAGVDFDRKGMEADHIVLIVGARVRYEEHPPGSLSLGTYHEEVLVSCSARSTPDEEWVHRAAFLRERGGFNLLLARPGA